ncbi:MAG TPA: phosphotransferase family protein [Acidimicrobiales bacterium]|nr:phosphotransferase family protein [Acidimicrobiales bacterium]
MTVASEADRAALQAFGDWLGTRLPGAVLDEVERPATGASNGTYLCAARLPDGGRRDLVLRLQPVENQFLDPDVMFQHRVMEMLSAHSGLPIPVVLWAEPDPAVLGRPFFVMERVRGRVLPDSHHVEGWALDLQPDERARLYDGAVRALAELHEVPVGDHVAFLRRPGTGTALDRHMAWLVRWHRWAARGRALPVIDAGLRYVLDTCPDDPSEHVIWGDGRPGNMVFGEDLSVAAVLDWELAATGPAEIDVAWWLMFERSQTVARGVEPLPGVPDAEEIVGCYEQLRGVRLADLDFYRVLAELQFAIIVHRYVDMQVAAGLLPPDTDRARCSSPALMLAESIGVELPEPSGGPGDS